MISARSAIPLPVCAAALSAASTFASAAAALDDLPRWHVALRTGFGLPMGKYADVRTLASVRLEQVNALGDDTYGVIPLWFDAGYRLTPQLMLGGYFVFGLVLPKVAPASDPLGGGCPENFDCSALGLRAGLQAQYTFVTDGSVRPWIGAGVGYEWVNTEIEGQELDIQLDTWHSGPEFLQLQGGVDFPLHGSFALGPFATLSAMQYASCSLVLSGEEAPCELNETAWHGWILLGVRGSLHL